MKRPLQGNAHTCGEDFGEMDRDLKRWATGPRPTPTWELCMLQASLCERLIYRHNATSPADSCFTGNMKIAYVAPTTEMVC